MNDTIKNGGVGTQDTEFRKFAWLRIIAAVVIAVAVLWAITWFIDLIGPSEESGLKQAEPVTETHEKTAGVTETRPETEQTEAASPGETAAVHEKTQAPSGHEEETAAPGEAGTAGHEAAHPSGSEAEPAETSKPEKESAHAAHGEQPEKLPEAKGVLFVNSLIEPINHELNERFWGWRPNDILNFTDNVNEMQLGILEVTRRTTVALTEKISRAGSASALNPHLENAMNSFMINADSYWMPSAESKYNEAIRELETYSKQLKRNQASFYTRSDSLIPLLQTLEDLLGSCDENLVKHKEENGEPVSTFAADNYFYYAKGVATAMVSVLEAVDIEFATLLEVRGARDIMHHAIESAHHASQLDPWFIVTEASLNGIFANHRANMAAHISHARYYLGVLVKTLST